MHRTGYYYVVVLDAFHSVNDAINALIAHF
jgi:hypothetical protein